MTGDAPKQFSANGSATTCAAANTERHFGLVWTSNWVGSRSRYVSMEPVSVGREMDGEDIGGRIVDGVDLEEAAHVSPLTSHSVKLARVSRSSGVLSMIASRLRLAGRLWRHLTGSGGTGRLQIHAEGRVPI